MNSYFKDDRNFKKSSASMRSYPYCVYVAISPEQEVAIRDSKDPDKSTLVFNREEWIAFVEGVRNGEFDVD